MTAPRPGPSADDGVLILRSHDLRGQVPLRAVVDGVERAYRLAGEGRLEQQPRVQVREDAGRTFLHMMGAVSAAAGYAGAHVYTGGNRGAGVAQKVTLLFGTDDGGLRAIIESNWLSWARTGATGAVATRYLARADATVLGVIGSGRQAAAQVQAIAASRPLSRVFVFSRSAEHRQAFATEMAGVIGLPVEPLDSAEELVARCDIVSTATTAHEPVFGAGVARPGLHINAIGAHYPDRREIDGMTMTSARIVVDDVGRSVEEDGERQLAVADGLLAPDHAVVGLAAVVAGTAPGRTAPDELTVFLSGGLGSEYLLAAAAVYELAAASGLGMRVQL